MSKLSTRCVMFLATTALSGAAMAQDGTVALDEINVQAARTGPGLGGGLGGGEAVRSPAAVVEVRPA